MTKIANIGALFLVLIFQSSCSWKSGSGGSPSALDVPKDAAQAQSANCNEVIAQGEDTGGCRIRLVSPTVCEEIDLSGGKTYEFAWTTDGTNCETPYKLYIAGNPVDLQSSENIKGWSLSAKAGEISGTGGVYYVSAAHLEGLQSQDGIYHWVVAGWYGSKPNTQTFRVKK